MKLKVSVFIAISLDGYIARCNGDLDWLDEANATIPAGEDCGYSSFWQSIDMLVMGRKTYEKVLSFGSWPYGNTAVTVLSRAPIAFPERIPATVRHSSEDPITLCDRLADADINHIYVDGGYTITRFMSAGLVDELTLTIIPIILGSGTPLFGRLAASQELECLDSKHYDFGFVQLKYRMKSHQ